MTEIVIRKENGRWLVNDKPYGELSPIEKQFFNDFLADMKIEFYNSK